MPSLLRLLTIAVLLCAVVYGGLYALAHFVQQYQSFNVLALWRIRSSGGAINRIKTIVPGPGSPHQPD